MLPGKTRGPFGCDGLGTNIISMMAIYMASVLSQLDLDGRSIKDEMLRLSR